MKPKIEADEEGFFRILPEFLSEILLHQSNPRHPRSKNLTCNPHFYSFPIILTMKYLIQFSGVAIGLFMGLYLAPEKPRPAWWRWIALGMLTLTIVLGLAPRTAGNFSDAVLMRRAGMNPIIPVKVKILHETKTVDEASKQAVMQMTDFAEGEAVQATVRLSSALAQELSGIQTAVLRMERDSTANDGVFVAHSLIVANPLLTLPFIPQLEERARNLYFHVPMSWVAMLAYIVAMVYGFRYLKTRNQRYDILSSSAAALGTLFTLLATITGAIWAKFNWGSFWNWDPRETSIFILLLMYGAYFALRQAIDSDDRRARLSAVYVIFAVVPAVFLMFIMPRIMDGLHPGAGSDGSAGPILSTKKEELNLIKQVIFSLAFGSFTMLFFWMHSLQVRITTMQRNTLEQS
jgi:heme exporter protein C